MTSRRSQLQEDTYFRVLRMLQDNPDMTQREIAERLGVSTSGMNYCLNALIDKGWGKVHNFSQSKNKFGYILVLTPQGIMEKVTLAGRFLKRKQAEYAALKAEIDGLTIDLSPFANAKPESGPQASCHPGLNNRPCGHTSCRTVGFNPS
jgi:EPS-associated MarR family transcriptional regulator